MDPKLAHDLKLFFSEQKQADDAFRRRTTEFNRLARFMLGYCAVLIIWILVLLGIGVAALLR